MVCFLFCRFYISSESRIREQSISWSWWLMCTWSGRANIVNNEPIYSIERRDLVTQVVSNLIIKCWNWKPCAHTSKLLRRSSWQFKLLIQSILLAWRNEDKIWLSHAVSLILLVKITIISEWFWLINFSF